MLAEYPEWMVWIRAAERLGCSVFDLIARPDVDYWLSCVAAMGEFEKWQSQRH